MDVSGHQTLAQVQTLAADAANVFVIVKDSEGQNSQSASRTEQVAAVRAAGKLVGHYAYVWASQDPAADAANFLKAADIQPGELYAADVEKFDDTTVIDWPKVVTATLGFVTATQAAAGGTPLVYLNWTWIKGIRGAATAAQWAQLTTSSVLWLAEWTGVPGQHSTVKSQDGTNPDCWRILVHQYGVVDGIDRDWTPDIAALKACAATKAA